MNDHHPTAASRLRLAPFGRPQAGHIAAVQWGAWGQPGRRPVLATGSWDGTVRLWDPAIGEALGGPLTGHTAVVWGAWGRAGGQLAERAGGAANVTGKTVFMAARAGDETARALFQKLGRWLGIGIASLVNLFDFELIVIGGGVADAGDLLPAPAKASFERFVFAGPHRRPPPIVAAHLGPEAGWIGSAILALDQGESAGLSRPEMTAMVSPV